MPYARKSRSSKVGGSVGLGALLANKVSHLGEIDVAVVVSGGNVDLGKLLTLVGQPHAYMSA